jgi:uncharacterized protein (DUF58 family)
VRLLVWYLSIIAVAVAALAHNSWELVWLDVGLLLAFCCDVMSAWLIGAAEAKARSR